MSRKRDGSSGVGTALVVGLIGAGIGALGAFIGSKLLDQQKQKAPAVEQYQLPPRKRRTIFQGDKKQQITHSPSFQQTLECPVSQELMEDPVTIPECGHSFDRSTIVPILNKYHICPLCRKPTHSQNLVPNYQLKSVLDHYKQTKK